MNLQHSQWNHLLGFGGLARKVAKSDSNIINEYYGHMRSNRPRLRYPCSTADDGFGQPYTIHFKSGLELRNWEFCEFVENKQRIVSIPSENVVN